MDFREILPRIGGGKDQFADRDDPIGGWNSREEGEHAFWGYFILGNAMPQPQTGPYSDFSGFISKDVMTLAPTGDVEEYYSFVFTKE